MENKEYIFNSPNYIHTMIEYSGKFTRNIKNNSGIYVTLINDEYAILSINVDLITEVYKFGVYSDINLVRELLENYSIISEDFKVRYILPNQIFTLQEISAIEAVQVNFLQADMPLNLTGEGVVVGVIDTGIDYLNEEFRDADGNSRIIYIWDQTIQGNKNENIEAPFGTVYSKSEINKAIQAYDKGKNPYDIVPSRDVHGHGTGMAGIVGARGENKDIKGIAPDCEFVIVKLSEANFLKQQLNLTDPVFAVTSIFSAIEYLRSVLLKEKKPIVILLPLGSNNGNHKGDNILNGFIESVSSNVGIILVTGSGNEGNQDGHVSGTIINKESIEIIELLVEKKQKFMSIEIWIDLPSILDVNLVAPSGEETGFIAVAANASKETNFIFEQSKTYIRYFLPEEYTGEQLISIVFSNITPGIWQVKLRLRNGEVAKYNAWMPQRGIVIQGTRFSPSNPYGTVTIPGDSDFVVTVAAYNQNNNNLLSYSGVDFMGAHVDTVDFAAGGVNTMTVGIDNSTQLVNGTSLSAAIGAGVCVLLFQWGIVKGNYPYMYSQSIKTFLRRGVIQREKTVYPTPGWGYGIINFLKIFENMM